MITLGQLASRYAAASKKAPGSKELKRLAVVGVGLMKRQIQHFHVRERPLDVSKQVVLVPPRLYDDNLPVRRDTCQD